MLKGKEGEPFTPIPPSKLTVLARVAVREVFRPFIPYNIVGDAGGLVRAEQLQRDGYGAVIFFNHFSKRDIFQIFENVIFAQPAMLESTILTPEAYHQRRLVGDVLASLLAIHARLIVTSDTLRIPKYQHLRQGLGLKTYIRDAAKVLAAGGTVVLSPQAGRRSSLLGEDPQGAVELLTNALRIKGIDRVAFTFIGLSLAEVTDYRDPQVAEYNIGRSFDVALGPTYTLQEARTKIGGGRFAMDRWILQELSPLVPTAYLGNETAPKPFR
ncbi:hypothetical protein HYV22_02925 [Candidatus Gottesmanbacteria bacterium]|nr:hypothetical protein [Candidatus Gottesmanbacteria bacterium]